MSSDFEIIHVEGNDPAKLNDPWGQPFQIGSADNGTGTVSYYVFTTNPDTGEEVGRIISARKATAHERRAYEEGDF